MKSRLAKVLHPVAGRPMIHHVLEAARAAGARRQIVVVGVQAQAVRDELADLPDVVSVVQRERRGTADAVRAADRRLREVEGDVLVLCGDVPLLGADTLKALVRRHRRARAALTVLTARVADPKGYGRILRRGGEITEIVEEKDATPAQREVDEINSGTYLFRADLLRRAVRRIRPENAQKEYYLTDAVRLLLAEGEKVATHVAPDPGEILGINDRSQLALVSRLFNQRVLRGLMREGVTLIDPLTTWVDARARVGRDTVIHPGVTIEGDSTVGEGCRIHSGVRLRDTRVEDGAVILDHCLLLSARVGPEAQVGPFAHLRPGSVLGPRSKVGNFVETKKAVLGEGTKASHLTYLGDATIGDGVNVGAGTITCNYDGVNKNPTHLGDGVFIGSGTQLVAPVTVGKGAYVGAGAAITEDVPAGALAVARARQVNIEGWVERKKAEKKKAKGKKPKGKKPRGKGGTSRRPKKR
jgi:bifunctional UDP-N-acetylglucosamine pyrophosphorylase/glucosamine-1-phosphate N-acetyltransferase